MRLSNRIGNILTNRVKSLEAQTRRNYIYGIAATVVVLGGAALNMYFSVSNPDQQQ